MKITNRKTNDLIPYINNARTHGDSQINQIAASINEFGFTNPVLIDQDGGIIAGHGRVSAAKKLNHETVPCIVLSDLSEAQKKAYIIADNKLALNAGWDEELLKTELERLKELDFDLDLLGFDEDLADLLPGTDTAGLTDPDDIPDTPETPVSVVGDVWQLGKHRVMCGDSTQEKDVSLLMEDKKASLLHADPPYGMGKEKDGVLNDNIYRDKLDKFQLSWLTTCRHFIENNSSVYIWGKAENLYRLWFYYLINTEKLTFRNLIIWNKKSGIGIRSESHRIYATVTEHCFFMC